MLTSRFFVLFFSSAWMISEVVSSERTSSVSTLVTGNKFENETALQPVLQSRNSSDNLNASESETKDIENTETAKTGENNRGESATSVTYYTAVSGTTEPNTFAFHNTTTTSSTPSSTIVSNKTESSTTTLDTNTTSSTVDNEIASTTIASTTTSVSGTTLSNATTPEDSNNGTAKETRNEDVATTVSSVISSSLQWKLGMATLGITLSLVIFVTFWTIFHYCKRHGSNNKCRKFEYDVKYDRVQSEKLIEY